MLQAQVKRTNVTIDDRRAVIVLTRNRPQADVDKVSHEQFLRRALKDRLGWPQRDPAPQAVLDAAKQMAKALGPSQEVATATNAKE